MAKRRETVLRGWALPLGLHSQAEGQSVGAGESRAGQHPRAPGAKRIDSRLGRCAPWLRLRIPWKENGEEARAPLQSISWRRGPVPAPAPRPHQPLRRRAGKRHRGPSAGPGGQSSRRAAEPRLLPAPPGYRSLVGAKLPVGCQTLPGEHLLLFIIIILSAKTRRFYAAI